MADSRLCLIPTCNKSSSIGGMCYPHHYRLKRYGDPNGGRALNGAPNLFYQSAKSYAGDDCLIWPYAKSADGYGVMNGGSRSNLVSRLMCEEEHGPAPDPSMDASHSCGNGHLGCVNRKHLSWKTRAGNMADKLIHGTMTRGEKHGASKLTADSVREIRSLIGTITNQEIADRFGITDRTVSKIKLGQRWAHLP